MSFEGVERVSLADDANDLQLRLLLLVVILAVVAPALSRRVLHGHCHVELLVALKVTAATLVALRAELDHSLRGRPRRATHSQ